jgi:hypothetical protein
MMHMRAVIDKKGAVVAVSLPDPQENEEEPILRSGPVLEEGEKEIELDVPGEDGRLSPDLVRRVKMEIEKNSAT